MTKEELGALIDALPDDLGTPQYYARVARERKPVKPKRRLRPVEPAKVLEMPAPKRPVPVLPTVGGARPFGSWQPKRDEKGQWHGDVVPLGMTPEQFAAQMRIDRYFDAAAYQQRIRQAQDERADCFGALNRNGW
jgi:hypothetical protein